MKPKLIVYDTNRDITTKVVMKFAQGASASKDWEVRFQKIDKFKKTGLDRRLRPGIDAVASLGVLRGTGLMFRAAEKENIDYFYMDHAYFNPGYGGDGWMRIVKNAHTMNWRGRSNGSKYNNNFQLGNPILPWKRNTQRGDQIVVCPPTNAVSWYANLNYNWTEFVVSRLKDILPKNQHHRIVVRPKPNESIVDKYGNLTTFRKNHVTEDISQTLKNAHCVIAFNSMVALTATLKGIPVIVGDYNCCNPITFHLEDIANSEVFDFEPKKRINLIHWLADNQWSIEEIRKGIAWQELTKSRT